jgi:hypothetical protein
MCSMLSPIKMIIWKTYQISTGREVYFNLVPMWDNIQDAFEPGEGIYEYEPTDYETYSFEVIEL